MSTLDSEHSERELKRRIVSTLREHESALSYRQLANQIGVSERDVRDVLSELVDTGEVTLTPSWEYETE